MYKVLLILRYFQRRLVALFALLAVSLCTAMVIIVISVMGGFLDLMTHTAKSLSGDVVIQRDLTGFPDYEQLIVGLRELEQVAGAAAIVRGFGLIKIHGAIRGVYISGIRPDEFNTVTDYRDKLHWSSEKYRAYLERMVEQYGPSMADTLSPRIKWFDKHDLNDHSMKFRSPLDESDRPGMVPGIAVSPVNERDKDGQYNLWHLSTGSRVTLTVLPITTQGGFDDLGTAVEEFTVVNEFKSGFMELDVNFVYVQFDVLQRMLGMHEQEEADPETGQPTGNTFAARATEIVILGHDDYSLDQIEQAVDSYVAEFTERRGTSDLIVKNWLEDRWGTILAAVQKEKAMMAFLFGVISLVAVVMVAVIFYMIVMEKTRDIGVLRALGASRSGIASVFLGYALLVGVIGASLGLVLSAAVVWNLNDIQDLLARWFGFKMWDPQIYYFDKIPSRLDVTEVTVIMISAVVASVLGALIPAWLAARTDPVGSLRYE